MIILLDTTPLGIATHPEANKSSEIIEWILAMRAKKNLVKVPAISDYELRRELLRRNATKPLKNLDDFGAQMGFVPLTNRTLKLAAKYWAQIRQLGRGGSGQEALDGDVILAAQAMEASDRGVVDVVIATENPKHFDQLPVKFDTWRNIRG